MKNGLVREYYVLRVDRHETPNTWQEFFLGTDEQQALERFRVVTEGVTWFDFELVHRVDEIALRRVKGEL